MPSISATWCAVKGCGNNSNRNPDKSFFRYPRNPERLTECIESTQRFDLQEANPLYAFKNCKVCSNHFEDHLITRTKNGKPYLHRDAIPTIFSAFCLINRKTQVSDENTHSNGQISSSNYLNNSSQFSNNNVPSNSQVKIASISTTISTASSTPAKNSKKRLPFHVVSSCSDTEINPLPFSPSFTSTVNRSSTTRVLTLTGSRKLLYDSESPKSNSHLTPDLSSSTISANSNNYKSTDDSCAFKSYQNKATETDAFLSSNTPRKKTLRKEKKCLNAKLIYQKNKSECPPKPVNKLATFDHLCDEFLPKTLCDIIKEQARLSQKEKPKGRRYSLKVKKFALAVLYMSPKAYRLLQSIMILPSVRCLRQLTQKWKLKPGFNPSVFAVLKTKVASLPADRRICTLTGDEMSLKSNLFYNHTEYEIVGVYDIGSVKSFRVATHALVLMASGILDNWKQPLAYFFVNNSCSAYDLKYIVETCIRKLHEIDLTVKVFTSDQGSNFEKCSKLLGVETVHPFFFVDGKKIFRLYDVPHLAKSWRNNLMKYLFEFDGKTADWKHLVDFYQIDKHLSLRLAPKLTDSQIDPNNFEKMKVKYATQVFSATVAAALYTYVSLNVISNSALPLAELLDKGDKLFDLLNSSKFRAKKKYNQPLRGKPYQIEFLYDMLRLLTKFKLKDKDGKDVTDTMHFIDGFKQTIRGVLDLWSEMKRIGHTHLFTRRLNQDCLENFFSMLRSMFGFCRNPTPIQVQRGFKKLFAISFFFKPMNTNCEEDFNEVLSILNSTDFDKLDKDAEEASKSSDVNEKPLNITENAKPSCSTEESETPINQGLTLNAVVPEKKEIKVCFKDYANIQLPFENALEYVSGYLLNKCLALHSCTVCVEYANQCDVLAKSNYFTHFKAYNTKFKFFGNLNTPAEEFRCFVYFMENTILEKMCCYATEKPATKLIKAIDKYKFKHPCEKFNYSYLVRLYVRFRIFRILTDNNRAFKEKSKEADKKNEKQQREQEADAQPKDDLKRRQVATHNANDEPKAKRSCCQNASVGEKGNRKRTRNHSLPDNFPPQQRKKRNQKLLNLRHL